MNLSAVFLGPVLLILTLHSSSVAAQPRDGFGLNLGLANHSMTATFTLPPFIGQQSSYTSSGLSIGVDYQIAASEQFSISPFLMSAGESASGSVRANTTVGHAILGLQLRFWSGTIFFGGHIGSYSEVLTDTTTSTSFGARGPGVGLVAGWEQPNGGLYVMGQMDSANVHYSDADVKVRGFRLSAGYRFK